MFRGCQVSTENQKQNIEMKFNYKTDDAAFCLGNFYTNLTNLSCLSLYRISNN